MIVIETVLLQLTERLRQALGDKLIYVGLQGSYLRGEATPASDIDIMTIIDGLNASDLATYRSIIRSMDHADKFCGFICSRTDMLHWNPLEICHLLHCTQDYFGTLRNLVPPYTEADIRSFVKMSLNNLHHEISHRFIYADAETNNACLPGTYKGVFFILQNLYYLRHGEYHATKSAMLQAAKGKDRTVLERAMELAKGEPCNFDESFQLLFDWCHETLMTL